MACRSDPRCPGARLGTGDGRAWVVRRRYGLLEELPPWAGDELSPWESVMLRWGEQGGER